jgi:predicted nucleic acid-binding protein
MTALVVDADVALKWHIRQEGSESARSIFRQISELHAPEFQLLEINQVLAKYVRLKLLDDDIAQEAAREHRELIEYWHHNTPLVTAAFDLAMLHRHAFYDCLYLALALRLDGRVVTADKKFAGRFAVGDHAGRVVMLADFAKGA